MWHLTYSWCNRSILHIKSRQEKESSLDTLTHRKNLFRNWVNVNVSLCAIEIIKHQKHKLNHFVIVFMNRHSGAAFKIWLFLTITFMISFFHRPFCIWWISLRTNKFKREKGGNVTAAVQRKLILFEKHSPTHRNQNVPQ